MDDKHFKELVKGVRQMKRYLAGKGRVRNRGGISTARRARYP